MRIMARLFGFFVTAVDVLTTPEDPDTTMLVGPLGEPILMMSMVDDILGVPSSLRRGQP